MKTMRHFAREETMTHNWMWEENACHPAGMHRPARHEKKKKERRKTQLALSRAVEWKWFMWQTRNAVSCLPNAWSDAMSTRRGCLFRTSLGGVARSCEFQQVQEAHGAHSESVKEAQGSACTRLSLWKIQSLFFPFSAREPRTENWFVVFGAVGSGRKEHTHTPTRTHR